MSPTDSEVKPPTEAEIVERFGSLSSLALRRIADAAEDVIRRRVEDGVPS